jgi:protein SCO1/2
MQAPPKFNGRVARDALISSLRDVALTHRRGLDPRLLLSLVVLVVIAGGVALLTIGGTSSTATSGGARQLKLDAAGVLTPVAAAPPLALRSYLGQRVNIDAYRGKAVLVTFLYTHCPDVCPLITSNLRVALNTMGPTLAAKTQIIVVSVDPRGDTPKAVAAFLARHAMTGRMQYLIGSAAELARVWKAWGVGSLRDSQHPELVEHSGLVYGITGSGRRLAIYAANFEPTAIAHDVPILAAD